MARAHLMCASEFASYARQMGRREDLCRDGNQIERYTWANGLNSAAVEKVTQPGGRHWHQFIPASPIP